MLTLIESSDLLHSQQIKVNEKLGYLNQLELLKQAVHQEWEERLEAIETKQILKELPNTVLAAFDKNLSQQKTVTDVAQDLRTPYGKLLDFVKEIAIVTGEPKIYKEEGYFLVFEARNLLKEIGELVGD